MRVLLAIDGSASSEAARRLVGSLRWPEASVIEVVTVREPIVDALGVSLAPFPVVAPGENPILEHVLQEAVDEAAASLETPGRIVRKTVLQGRAASVIVDEAEAFRAEIVVVGSRGLGPMRSMFLGSVSAEVVDHAPCPVLVVRRPTAGSILLAVDGSEPARAAVMFLAGARFLADHPVDVITVAPRPYTSATLPVPGTPELSLDNYRADEARRRAHAETIASSATEELRSARMHARWSISEGDAAHEIVEAARTLGSDLIVVGSRGRTGLSRMVLGSVARNVLLHSDASVLVVHEPVRARAAAPAHAEALVPAGA